MTAIAENAASIVVRQGRFAPSTLLWVALAWAAFALLPWYWTPGLGLGDWIGRILSPAAASGLVLSMTGDAWWLTPLLVPLVICTRILLPAADRAAAGTWLIVGGLSGLTYLAAQGFAIGLRGWNGEWLV